MKKAFSLISSLLLCLSCVLSAQPLAAAECDAAADCCICRNISAESFADYDAGNVPSRGLPLIINTYTDGKGGSLTEVFLQGERLYYGSEIVCFDLSASATVLTLSKIKKDKGDWKEEFVLIRTFDSVFEQCYKHNWINSYMPYDIPGPVIPCDMIPTCQVYVTYRVQPVICAQCGTSSAIVTAVWTWHSQH